MKYRREILRGDIYYASLNPVIGSEQGGVRPVLIIQNDVGNRHSPATIVAAITAKMRKHPLPTHVYLPKGTSGLKRNSTILLEQIRTIDQIRLKDYIGYADEQVMEQVDSALAISLQNVGSGNCQQDMDRRNCLCL